MLVIMRNNVAMKLLLKVISGALLLLHFSPVLADFSDGGKAYMLGDYAAAANHFQEAAERGDHRAMYALGSMYAGGNGVEQDYKQAYTWFRKAAKYGRPDAIYKLGLMYEQGLGLKQDYGKALRYFGKAAKAGYPQAQYKVGTFYANGQGVTANNVKAYAWLAVAYGKLENALQTPSQSEEASEEFLKDQDEFKQASTGNKLTDLKNKMTALQSSLSTEELSEAKGLIAKYSRY